jgi:hypothetical protein
MFLHWQELLGQMKLKMFSRFSDPVGTSRDVPDGLATIEEC